MECLFVLIFPVIAGAVQLILIVLSKLNLVDSDSELYITES